MLKHVLLSSAMIVAVPAFAQVTPSQPATGAAPTTTAPQAASPAQPAVSSAPTAAAPADSGTSPTQAPAQTVQAPAPSGDQSAETAEAPTSATDAPAETAQAPAATGDAPAQTAQTPAAPVNGEPAQTAAAPAPATGQPAQTAQAAEGAAAPASTDVAQIVESEFGTYDKNGDGALSKVEFAAWMDALKAKMPAGETTTAAKADPKYNDNAFAQADADKSKGVSKVELTSFLGGGSSAGA